MNPKDIERMSLIEDTHWWYKERRYLLLNVLRKFQVSGSAVDIGAAGGGNTQVLLEWGLNTLAIETEPVGLEILQNKGIRSLKCDATDIPLPDNSFDFVSMMDVLEHINDDELAIKEIYRILHPTGLLFLTVPMQMSLWSSHDATSMHFRRYEKHGLVALLKQEQFELLSFKYWNVILCPVLRFRRRFGIGNDLLPPSAISNTVLSILISLERFFPFHRMKGVSGVVIARAIK